MQLTRPAINVDERAPVAVEHVPCPGCGGTDEALVASGPDYDNHCCGDQQFRLVQCQRCRVYYLNPRPTAAMLPVIYGAEEYYSYSLSEKGNRIVLRARQRRDVRKIKALLQRLDKRPDTIRVLDIGAGDGALLRSFELAGVPPLNLFGVDLEPNAIANLQGMGFQGVLGRAEELDFARHSFDVVTMIQVIEHVAAPKDLMRRIHRMLTPGGVFLLETPNMASWDRRLFAKKTWGGYHFPRHWTLWTPTTITQMLHEVGFTVQSIATPAAAVTWTWSLNHVAQERGWPPRLAEAFSMHNPMVLGIFWMIDLIPGLLGWSANMRVIARV